MPVKVLLECGTRDPSQVTAAGALPISLSPPLPFPYDDVSFVRQAAALLSSHRRPVFIFPAGTSGTKGATMPKMKTHKASKNASASRRPAS